MAVATGPAAPAGAARAVGPDGSTGPVATERLRRQNTALLLRSLRDAGPASRAALAQRTGLSKATVGTIVQALAGAGAVREDADAAPPLPATTRDGQPGRTGRTGRPGRPVRLDGAATVGLGLEVNVDHLAATALDLSGRTVLTRQRPADPAPSTPAELAALAVDAHAELVASGYRVLGVVAAVPALVDGGAGVVVDAPNLGWRDVDVVATVRAALTAASVGQRPGVDVPVGVDNDANCAALAEHVHGAARGHADALYLTGTVGIGAGLVVDGQVRRGSGGFAGEVGHVPFGGSTTRCACGRRGCWEASVGLRAVLAAAGLRVRAGTDPAAAGHALAARAGVDARAAAAVRRLADDLALGLLPLVGALDPSLVVLGGYFVPLGDLLLPTVRAVLAERAATVRAGRPAPPVRVELSTLGVQAAATGAATDVLAGVYAGTLALA